MFKNIKFKNKSNLGFTLIEVLTVIAIFATVGAIASTTLVSSLRGNNKTNTILDVKENGNHALFLMTKTIRYAKKFGGVIESNGDLRTDCSTASSLATYKGVRVTSFDDKETTFECCINSDPENLENNTLISSQSGEILSCSNSNRKPILDINNVYAESCSFTCSQLGSSDFPSIGINFSLKARGDVGEGALFEKTASVSALPFQTTVIMRNLYK